MGILQKKCRTTGQKVLAYKGKGGQNTDTAFLALRLGVVLYLFIECLSRQKEVWCIPKGLFSSQEGRYIYIYIYMAITSISGPKTGQNFKISPVL